MADKTIGDLPLAATVQDDSLIPVEQQGEAMHMTGAQFKAFARGSVQEYVTEAQTAANEAKQAVLKAPQVGDNGNWYVYDHTTAAYVDTGVAATGPQGETGPQGIQGEKGETGETGPQGPQGEQGIQGETGPQGEQGIQGEQGPQGIQGEQGPVGPRGEKGETGSGFKVSGYYDTAGELEVAQTAPNPGDAYGVGTAEPYDIYIWDGVNLVWVNNGALQGAQGEQGPQGEPGPEGPQGPAGETGPTGPKGEPGESGLTPYIGTNGNWYVGATDTGIPATGPEGAEGKTPYIGDNGNWYIDGVDTGAPARGPVGPKGTDGAAGANATINGVNALTLTTDENLELEQTEGVATLKLKSVPSNVYYATAVIPATGWAADETTGIKSQTVAISGITANHTATVSNYFTGPETAAGYAAHVEQENQFLDFITNGYAETVDGGIKFVIYGDANTVAIPIVVEVAS